MGSYLEWQTVPGSNDRYKVRLILYLDATSAELEQQQQPVYLFKNNRHWETGNRKWLHFESIMLERLSSREVGQDTLACAGTGSWEDFDGQRHVFVNIYEKTVNLPDLQRLSSNNGFIIGWHSIGTRDGKDSNSVNSGNAFEWVTTFIPPMTMTGARIRNSSPVIGNLNTFFVCKDDLETIQFSAVDSDGDQLKYKLSKPGIVMSGGGLMHGEIFARDLIWANGYNDQNQVHGNPGLTINENTGEMTVKADEAGQYFIGLSVEEYRNGQKIGAVSFYYTLVVVDCNQQQVFDKKLYHDTTAVQTLTICQGSEATLTSRQTFPGPQPEFQWTKDGKPIWGATSQSITVKENGNYQLLTTRINGCPDSFDSETVNVIVASSAGAALDSIPPICDISAPPVALNATPFGGTFAGPGVAGNTFDPGIAGVGRHEVEYTFQGSADCPGSVAKREVIVSETPVLDLEDVLYGSRGKPIQIVVKDSLDVTYQWTPPNNLNSDFYANPTSTPSGGITYTVTATNAYGCAASRNVQIKIIESILIPDAFTPNNDGINETWELKGIEGYPNCRVTIYNRWGTVVFNSVGYQNAFDGTVAGALQMPGVYAYKIRLTENSPELAGSVTLIR